MEPAAQPPISDALNQLWVKFLPQMEERLAVLFAANHALATETLTEDERLAAAGAAHKLAGVLGTFGLAEGTNLAREAERAFSNDMTAESVLAARLAEIAHELAVMIRNRA